MEADRWTDRQKKTDQQTGLETRRLKEGQEQSDRDRQTKTDALERPGK